MKNESFVDDVLRKVGRNVVLFQQLEQLLKLIVANSHFAGAAHKIKAIQHEQENKVNRQTMGILVGQYVENSNPSLEVAPREPEPLDEAYMSFSFKIGCDESYYLSQKQNLAQLVSDRNDLIHHLLLRFDLKCAKSCETLGKELDEQADKIRRELKSISSVANDLYKGRNELFKKLSELLTDESLWTSE